MKLGMLTIADYAATRPDGTLDIVRGGQTVFLVTDDRHRLTRSIAFQMHLTEAEFERSDRSVEIAVLDSDGKVIGLAQAGTGPAGGSTRPDGADDGVPRYGLGGAITTQLDLEREGEYSLQLKVNGEVIGSQWFAVLRVPDVPSAVPAEVVEGIRPLAT